MTMTPANPQGIITAYRVVARHCQGAIKASNGNRDRATLALWTRCRKPGNEELAEAAMLCGIVSGIENVLIIETSAAA